MHYKLNILCFSIERSRDVDLFSTPLERKLYF